MSRKLFIGSAILAMAASVATAAVTVQTSFSQPASVYLSEQAEGCSNNPGPFVTLNGEIKLGGVNARVIFTNNRKFTHVTSQDTTADVVILPAGESISIAKQPPEGGVGGNPWIYLQFNDCAGGPLTTSPTRLGRCVQGLNDTALNFDLPSDLELTVTSGSCSGAGGPNVELEGELTIGGLCADLILTNNAKFTHVTSKDIVVGIVLLADGSTLTIPKSPAQGGAGGNPYIYIQLLDGASQPISAPVFIGRCNQI